MKKIALTPDWILENLTISMTCDENAVVTLESDLEDRTAQMLIDLAFETIGVEPQIFDINNGIEGQDGNDWYTTGYNLPLEALRPECPKLYAKLHEIYLHNLKKFEDSQVYLYPIYRTPQPKLPQE